MSEKKSKPFVNRDSFWAEASVMLMALAMVFCAIGSIGHGNDPGYLIGQLALPVVSGLLFILCVLLFGRRAFWTSILPVALGAAYFVIHSMKMDNELQVIAFVILSLAAAALYIVSLFQKKIRWVLAALLAGDLGFRLAVWDIPPLMKEPEQIRFIDGMDEMCVLAALLAILCICLAIRFPKPVAAEPEVEGEPAEGPAETPEELPAEEPETPAEPAPESAPEETPAFYAEPAPAFPLDEPEHAESGASSPDEPSAP